MMFSSFNDIYKEFILQKCTYNYYYNKASATDSCLDLYLTLPEKNEHRILFFQELELTTLFKLLTKLEAELRLFHLASMRRELNIPHRHLISRELLEIKYCNELKEKTVLYNKAKKQIEAENEKDFFITDIIKYISLSSKINSELFNKTLNSKFRKFRNWYAHGRYEKQPKIKTDVISLNTFCNNLDDFVFNPPQNT